MKSGNYSRIAFGCGCRWRELRGAILIEAGMDIRYDGVKKTHKWCDSING